MKRRAGAWVPFVVVAASCHGPALREGTSASASASRDRAAEIDRDAGADAGARTGDAASLAARPRSWPKLDAAAMCALPVGPRGAGRPGAARFTRVNASCGADPFCDTADHAPDPKDACFVANDNLARAERASRGAPSAGVSSAAATAAAAAAASASATPAPPASRPSPPRFFDRIDAHLHLADDESMRLAKNGFVVLDRLSYDSYAVAYHDVFQEELPVYVGVDSILNAVYQATQMLLMEIETTRLGPRLASMLPRMRATLYASKGRYAAETIDDLDLYLTVAMKLLRPNVEPSKPRSSTVESDADALVARALDASELAEVELFGRARMIDFTQYAPRGYYAPNGSGAAIPVAKGQTTSLADYFRAMTWLSRLELNLVSRSCRSSQPGAAVDPRETPREARDALALADLVGRAGALDDLRAFETTYSVFAGRREDVPVPELLALASTAHVAPSDAGPGVADALKRVIGDRFRRTARTHFMPEGAGELPVIATLMGPRIVPDVAPLTGLVHDRLPNRTRLGFADVAYVLGHDRAKAYLAKDLAAFPALAPALDAGRAELAASARAGKDVYSAWIGAVARLGEPARGTVPSFMKTEAYADMKMSSALAGYAQIRHTFVLLAGQGYDAYGCEIPDGWVEPALGTYDALVAWTRAARVAAPERAAYFRRVEEVLGMLRGIAQTELAGAKLSEPQRRWLAMVSEHVPADGYGDSGAPPKWTGWYFDLFPDREHGAERSIDLVADYFTLTNADEVRYLGIEKAAMGVFVVDTNGERRAMVGPVAKPYEITSPLARRLDDERARKASAKEKTAPWLSYVAPATPEPPLVAELVPCAGAARVVVQSVARLGEVTITPLDHHGDPVAAPVTRTVDADAVAFGFDVTPDAVEGFHLAVKSPRWDYVVGPSVYRRSSGGVAFGAMAPPRSE